MRPLNFSLLRAIIALGQDMNLNVIAEECRNEKSRRCCSV